MMRPWRAASWQCNRCRYLGVSLKWLKLHFAVRHLRVPIRFGVELKVGLDFSVSGTGEYLYEARVGGIPGKGKCKNVSATHVCRKGYGHLGIHHCSYLGCDDAWYSVSDSGFEDRLFLSYAKSIKADYNLAMRLINPDMGIVATDR